jgi:phosphatidylcholine synthase
MDDAPKRLQSAAGYLVHGLTASGAAAALLALYAAVDRDFPATFAWLGLALIIDGVDGALARAARVSRSAPLIDGAALDLVVDFLGYVVTPMAALWRSDLMPQPAALAIGLIVVTASALYFADRRMKTGDHWFRGFPALWNVLVFYLFVFRPPWPISAAAVLLAAAAMFAPIVNVHPLRVSMARRWTLAVGLAWAILASLTIWRQLQPDPWVKFGLAAAALYFLALPLARRAAGDDAA